MKIRLSWLKNASFAKIFATAIVVCSGNANAEAQPDCAFRSYSVAEITPAFEVSSGISDDYKSNQLKVLHTNQVTDKMFGSVNKDFLTFKSLQVDSLLKVLMNGSQNQLSFLPAKGDIQLVFWESEKPYFDRDFWYPKYIQDFFATPIDSERHFNSPWIKIRFNFATCKIRILTLWNVRQFIADEAFLSGMIPVRNGVITALNDTKRDLPKEYLEEVIGTRYYTSNMRGVKERPRLLKEIKSGQSARMTAAKTRMPSELHWFFSSVDTHVGRTGTGSFMELLIRKKIKITLKASEDLVSNSRTLADGFLEAKSKSVHVDNVVELTAFRKKKN